MKIYLMYIQYSTVHICDGCHVLRITCLVCLCKVMKLMKFSKDIKHAYPVSEVSYLVKLPNWQSVATLSEESHGHAKICAFVAFRSYLWKIKMMLTLVRIPISFRELLGNPLVFS
jgi:hypothetical protein